MKKVLIFDFDGVISDSFHIAFELSKIQYPTITEDRFRARFDGNIFESKIEDELVNDIDFFEEFGKRFLKLNIKNSIKDSIIKLSKYHKMFIISSSPNFIIQEYLKRNEILECFLEILGSDIHASKVKKFNLVFQKYNIQPDQVVFLTDTSGDIYEAKKVSIKYIIGILGGYHTLEDLKKANPDNIVENFDEFFNLVQNL